MVIISFAWTTPAVKARVKTCTRRNWIDAYARRFKAGQHLMGYNKNPRIWGKPVQEIVLTMAPYKETYCQVPAADWVAEGFEYLEHIGATVHGMAPREIWSIWKSDTTPCWVVRFEYA
jgi:hypothetical protein